MADSGHGPDRRRRAPSSYQVRGYARDCWFTSEARTGFEQNRGLLREPPVADHAREGKSYCIWDMITHPERRQVCGENAGTGDHRE
jgi:hypothetical protein